METSLQNDFFRRLPKQASGLQRNALFLALLSSEMEARGYQRPVAVGGFAVEAYTLGRFMSMDIDLVGNRDGIIVILRELGFDSHDGRNWISAQFDVHIDIQGGSINIPGGNERVSLVEAADGCAVTMVSLTDIVADRISAYASGHKDSGIQARAILAAWSDHIDLGVLRDVCRQEKAASECEEIISLALADQCGETL
ncbi:MAG: hypothetical protein LBV80_09445 [Deltaproteobacteria bacterium]|jgi:hypothetical protein|nr:hypothetical protein [Deltaproteobacteria bacterium]